MNENNPYSTGTLSPPSDATLLACLMIRNNGETPVVTVGSVGTSNFGMRWQILAITGTDLAVSDGVVDVWDATDPSGASSITVNTGPIGMIVVELATTGTGGGGGSSGSVDVTVGSTGDDVYVSSSGSFSSSSGNLWYGRWNNGSSVVEESMYARFGGVSVPFGATITDAYVTFTLDNNYAASDMLATVRLQDSDDAVAPTSYTAFQGASRTGVVSVWLMQSSWSGDPTVQSGDLSGLVQEVVDRPGWVSGSAMGVFVEDPTSGSGTNDWGFWSYDKDPAKAPRLVIEYTVGGGTGGGSVVSDSVYIGGVYESTVTGSTTSESLYYSLNGVVGSRTDGIVEWVLSDQLGSPNTIIDATTGATSRRLFDPFGTVRFDDGVTTDRSLTGQYGDPSTGLLFYNARYYDPLVGRFISPDTIVPDPANPQDLNRYSYVRNNPATLIDPTGNCSISSGFPGISLSWVSFVCPGQDAGDAAASAGRGAFDFVTSTVNLLLDASYLYAQATSLGAYESDPIGRLPVFGPVDGYGGQYLAGNLLAGVGTTKALLSGTRLATGYLTRIGARSVATNAAGLLDDAAFAQLTYRESFSAGGRFAGQTIDDVAAGLSSGALSPRNVPIHVIVRDGNSLILSTRSAQALTRAGVSRSDWLTVNMTGNAAAEARLTAQLARNSLDNAGFFYPRSTGK